MRGRSSLFQEVRLPNGFFEGAVRFCLSAIHGVSMERKMRVFFVRVSSFFVRFIQVRSTSFRDLAAGKYGCNFALGNKKRGCNAWKFQIKVFI